MKTLPTIYVSSIMKYMNMLPRVPSYERTIVIESPDATTSDIGAVFLAILHRCIARRLWSGFVVADADNISIGIIGTLGNCTKGMRNIVCAKQ